MVLVAKIYADLFFAYYYCIPSAIYTLTCPSNCFLLSMNKARCGVRCPLCGFTVHFPPPRAESRLAECCPRSASDAQMVWAQRGSTKMQEEEQVERALTKQGQRLATESARQARVRSPTPLGGGSGESGGWPCGEVRPEECAVRVARRGCDDASYAKGQ